MPNAAATMIDTPPETSPTRGRPWRRTAVYWLPAFACYWGLLFVSTHTTQIEQIVSVSLFDLIFSYDKLLHLSAYFVLTTFALIAWRRTGANPTIRGRLAVAAAVLVYGAVDEITQPYFGRDCSLYDWLADGLGAGLAITLDQWRHRGAVKKV